MPLKRFLLFLSDCPLRLSLPKYLRAEFLLKFFFIGLWERFCGLKSFRLTGVRIFFIIKFKTVLNSFYYDAVFERGFGDVYKNRSANFDRSLALFLFFQCFFGSRAPVFFLSFVFCGQHKLHSNKKIHQIHVCLVPLRLAYLFYFKIWMSQYPGKLSTYSRHQFLASPSA